MIFSQSDSVQIIKKKIKFKSSQIKKEYEKTFRNEYKCLFFFDKFAHSNIIFLFDFYIYDQKHNFLFFNYKINFRILFRSEFRFENFDWNFTFFSIFRELVSVLCSIHKFDFVKSKYDLNIDAIEYYHDLWSDNVLINENVFIFADFELNKFKSINSLFQTQWKIEKKNYFVSKRMNKNHIH